MWGVNNLHWYYGYIKRTLENIINNRWILTVAWGVSFMTFYSLMEQFIISFSKKYSFLDYLDPFIRLFDAAVKTTWTIHISVLVDCFKGDIINSLGDIGGFWLLNILQIPSKIDPKIPSHFRWSFLVHNYQWFFDFGVLRFANVTKEFSDNWIAQLDDFRYNNNCIRCIRSVSESK